MAKTGVIYGINGPIVHIKGDVGFEMHEMVYVGKDNLVFGGAYLYAADIFLLYHAHKCAVVDLLDLLPGDPRYND